MNTFSLILRKTADSLRRNGISGRILVGLSGGADSVALLCALRAIRAPGSLDISAIYVNHGLRDRAAQEEVFCEKLCSDLDIPFVVKRVRVSSCGSTEAAAREARYQAFHEAMGELSANVLALAHHADDQAETMLLHLFYGTGGDGLGGMAEYRAGVWRPFLSQRRETLQAALQALGQTWCEDESNADTLYSRNYLRACVLPAIEERYPQAVLAMERASAILRDENDFLARRSNDWLKENASWGKWPFILTAALTNQHVALQRRILRSYAASKGIELAFFHVEELRRLIDCPAGAACNLPKGWHALKTKERIHFLDPDASGPKAEYTPEQLIVSKEKAGENGRLTHAVPSELVGNAVLRTRRPGDWIAPFGMSGRMKLKDYMIDRGMDRPFRADWPLLCIGSEVLWVIGVGASERLRVNPMDSSIYVTFSGALPDKL